MADQEYLVIHSLTRTEIDRIFNKIEVDPVTECWNWTANKTPSGYGIIWFHGKNESPHRLLYAWRIGPLPRGNGRDIPQIDHIVCSNPSCCNPGHLILTSLIENVLRSDAIPAVNARKTHCKRGHKLPPYVPGNFRRCEECDAIIDRTKYRRTYYLRHQEEVKEKSRAYRLKHRKH